MEEEFAPATPEELAEVDDTSDDFAPATPEELHAVDQTSQESISSQDGSTQQDSAEAKQLLSMSLGYGSGRAAQTSLEKLAEVPRLAAEKFGGLTPEQVDYYQQNYKAIEGGRGITPEGSKEGFQALEQFFKNKNIEASEAREAGRRAINTPLNRDLVEKAAEQALPKVLKPIDTEAESFKKVLNDRTSQTIDSEVSRLQDQIDQIRQQRAVAHEIAQSKAEMAGEQAVKMSKTPKKFGMPKGTVGLVKEAPVDSSQIYNKAFDEALKAAIPEQEKAIASLVKQEAESTNKLTDMMNEYYRYSNIEPQVQKQLIAEKQTKLARKYPVAQGYMDPEGIGEDINKIASGYDEVLEYAGPEAWDEATKMRNLAWSTKGSPAQVKDEAARAMFEEIRPMIAPEGSEADLQFKKTNKLLNQLKEAKQTGFIERNIGDIVTGDEDFVVSKFDPESVSIDKKQQEFISKVINPSKKDLQNPDITAARQIFDKIVVDDKLTDMAKISAIRTQLLDESKVYKVGPWDVLRGAIATLTQNPAAIAGLGAYEGVRYTKTPKGAYQAATIVPRLTERYPIATKLAKGAVKKLPLLGAGFAGVAAEAAAEATDVEPSGASPDMPDYWLEKGVRDPEEQIQRARLSSFKQDLPNQGRADEMPGPYDMPAKKQYKESVLKAKQAGQLKDNYVEKFEDTDSAKINEFMNFLQGSGDKLGEEYSRVLSQVADAPDREKSAVLFSLNQNPAFRQLAKRYKGNT